MSKPKFDYHEIVRVCSKEEDLEEIYGQEGVIRTKAQDEENGEWHYVISIDDCTWLVAESEIESLGRFAEPEDFSKRETIKVGVNEKGEGYLKEEE